MSQLTYEDKDSVKARASAARPAVDADDETVIDLKDVFLGLKRFWWLCLILAIVGGGIIFLEVLFTFEDMYKASATFTVSTESSTMPG